MKNTGLILLFSMVLIVGCDSGQDNKPATTSVESAKNAEATVVEEVKKAEEVIVAPKTEAVKTAPKISMNGEQVYKKSCVSCHGSGAAGAPKLGDAVAWRARIDKGVDALYSSAIKGVPGTAMMVKGTCSACSDEELHAAVDYMVSKVN